MKVSMAKIHTFMPVGLISPSSTKQYSLQITSPLMQYLTRPYKPVKTESVDFLEYSKNSQGESGMGSCYCPEVSDFILTALCVCAYQHVSIQRTSLKVFNPQ